MLLCTYCGDPVAYVHGHGACINVCCLYYGLNQAECCTGETAVNAPTRTSEVATVAAKPARHKPISK
jgi:hypothetical protein